MKPGYLRNNDGPYSDTAVVTEDARAPLEAIAIYCDISLGRNPNTRIAEISESSEI